MTDKAPVGAIRPSQLLWSYGPGAMVDLPNLSVMTMGIDAWEESRCVLVQEARLLGAVQKALGPQVKSLRKSPIKPSEIKDPYSAEAYIGIPVKPFPRWFRCVKCGLLSSYDLGLFEFKDHRYRPDRTKFIHIGCQGSKGNARPKDAEAVPARFLLACRNGHLDDFPWHYFVHNGKTECKGTLRFFESGASLQTENLWVKCDTCGSSRNMAHAFGKSGEKSLPQCRGRHPHINRFDSDCEERARAVLLGATNSWFPITVSVLAIPTEEDPLIQCINDGWEHFHILETKDQLDAILRVLISASLLPGIERFDSNDIWQAIEDKKEGRTSSTVEAEEIKGPEWEIFTKDPPPNDWPYFKSRKVPVPDSYQHWIESVLLVERLREVNALLGFTRIEAPEETQDPDKRPPRASLSKHDPTWVPVTDVHGEGIFIRFKEEVVKAWEEDDTVKERLKMLLEGHRGWRNERKLDPEEGFPRGRYVMLHTLSHILIRELALECGYNAASIRERIYAEDDGVDPQAGILLYTAAADSDGTLGGLVSLGEPDNLKRLLEQALERIALCSSDPLCAEHVPKKDSSLHASACHACSFVSETSCERNNRYLDRSLLVSTFKTSVKPFFQS